MIFPTEPAVLDFAVAFRIDPKSPEYCHWVHDIVLTLVVTWNCSF